MMYDDYRLLKSGLCFFAVHIGGIVHQRIMVKRGVVDLEAMIVVRDLDQKIDLDVLGLQTER